MPSPGLSLKCVSMEQARGSPATTAGAIEAGPASASSTVPEASLKENAPSDFAMSTRRRFELTVTVADSSEQTMSSVAAARGRTIRLSRPAGAPGRNFVTCTEFSELYCTRTVIPPASNSTPFAMR